MACVCGSLQDRSARVVPHLPGSKFKQLATWNVHRSRVRAGAEEREGRSSNCNCNKPSFLNQNYFLLLHLYLLFSTFQPSEILLFFATSNFLNSYYVLSLVSCGRAPAKSKALRKFPNCQSPWQVRSGIGFARDSYTFRKCIQPRCVSLLSFNRK